MAGPGGILSLDLSLTTGAAYGRLGEKPWFGHWYLGKMAQPGAVYARLEDEIDDAIKMFRPAQIVYEAPFAPQAQTNAQVGKVLLGLCAIVELIACRHDVVCSHQEVRTARKAVLGKSPIGGAGKVKPVIMEWARKRGWAVTQDDEADALLLLAYAVVITDKTRTASFFRYGELL
jgi:Holliday junction resolvasome RuvABC endonuclease subunit